MRLEGLAPAKLNLFLHVGAVQPDGYHPLSSLVAFVDIGDRVRVERADRLSLQIEGPFGAGLSAGEDNLIVRALRRLGQVAGIGEPGLKVTLDKRLPIAAGLGGGSADAGAALRLARAALDLPLDDAALEAAGADIGADGAMCVRSRPAWSEGRGDVLTPAPRLPAMPVVLVNPGAPSSTGTVYRAYDVAPRQADRPAPPDDWSAEGVIDWLSAQRNDLEPPAIRLEPRIGEARDRVAACEAVALARMSGSGATLFGLCRTAEDAARAAEQLSPLFPDGWVRCARVQGGESGQAL